MTLPQEKSQVENHLDNQVILIYGRPKIGKSTLASQFPEPLFLATEAGLSFLSVYKINITSWQKFLDVCAELSKPQTKFKNVVIDTIDNLVSCCTEYVCKREKIGHPSDYDYGKGWSMITQELHRALGKLSLLSYGLIMVGHSKVEEVKTKSKAYNKETITVTGENRKVVLSMADLVLFIDIERDENNKERRVIRTKPTLYYDAGDRSNRLPPVLPLDYKELAKHFINSGSKEPKEVKSESK